MEQGREEEMQCRSFGQSRRRKYTCWGKSDSVFNFGRPRKCEPGVPVPCCHDYGQTAVHSRYGPNRCGCVGLLHRELSRGLSSFLRRYHDRDLEISSRFCRCDVADQQPPGTDEFDLPMAETREWVNQAEFESEMTAVPSSDSLSN